MGEALKMAFLLKKCPGCGSVNVVKIVYGYSSYELFKMPMQEKSGWAAAVFPK